MHGRGIPRKILRMSLFPLAWATLACLTLSACSGMLPRSATQAPSTFQDFAAAQKALEAIVPFETRLDELPARGFDPAAGVNVVQVPYPEIAARLAPHPGVPFDTMDLGVRRCIGLQTHCRGYIFRYNQQHRQREGNFLLDFLNIERTTRITGWQFEALIVVGDGVVLFRNFGGEPKTDRTENSFNPLGPFQPAGESAGRSILR